MVFRSSSTPPRHSADDAPGDWAEPEKQPRDWKKRALVVGLALLSWVATYVGMLELIEANMGELPFTHKIIIGFSVAMLMTMVVWLLDEMFKPNPWFTKALYVFGYLFLTVISVGFGFGFYWKVLESRSEASRSAESAVTQVQGSLVAASTRLDQLTATLDQLTVVSTTKSQTERSAGTSCPNSKPGDGPRRKMREDDAARFSFAADFVKGRAATVKTEMAALDGDLLKIASDDKSLVDAKTGTRNAFMQGLERRLDNTVTGFNAFRTDPQLKQIRADLADRAERVTFPDTQGKTYSCPDPQLQTALRGVVRAIEQLPELEKPKIAAVEGSEATIEAFRRLTASFYGLLSFKMPPSADELRDLQKKAIQSVESPAAAAAAAKRNLSDQPGLSKRDYVPLAIAVFVDLCLLLVSMGKSHDRLLGLVPKMRAAERGPVIQILSRFNEIHRDRQIRENFELFRHVVFDFHGDYYVAVPLDAPRKLNPQERIDLRVETQLLSNLFASFEKEKIFTRVYSPFLTAGVVRKRLARQGSKFDNSDAFRLYRFKDGAWSDIILGAVMGAAKRVEAEKRVISARAEAAERTAAAAVAASPALPYRAPAATTQPAYPADPVHRQRFGAYAPFVEPQVYGDNVHPLPHRGTSLDPQRRTSPDPLRGTSPDPLRGTNNEPQPFDADAAATRWPQPELASPAGPPHWTGDASPAANSNTAPVVPFAPVAEVVPFTPPPAPRYAPQPGPRATSAAVAVAEAPAAAFTPAAAPDWQHEIGVVMTRVTESITVPVSQAAALPRSLHAAGLLAAQPAALENPDQDAAVSDFARRYVRQPGE